MRIKVHTPIKEHLIEIRAMAEWVASHFPMIRGRVNAFIKKSRNPLGTDHGKCFRSYRLVKCFVNITEGAPYPSTVTERRYFKHASGNPNPYTLYNWKEALIHVLTHELAHLTPANCNMRRSRQELHSENKGTSMIEEYRTEEAQKIIKERIQTLNIRIKKKNISPLSNVVVPEMSAAEFKKTYEYKIQKKENEIEKLERKLKRISKLLKKKQISLKYFVARKAQTSQCESKNS